MKGYQLRFILHLIDAQTCSIPSLSCLTLFLPLHKTRHLAYDNTMLDIFTVEFITVNYNSQE